MWKNKKTDSLRHKITSSVLLVTVSMSTFFANPTHFKNPFAQKSVMASEIQKKPIEDVKKSVEKFDKALEYLLFLENKARPATYKAAEDEVKKILQENKNPQFAEKLFTKIIDEYLKTILSGKKDEAELAYKKFTKLTGLLKDTGYLKDEDINGVFKKVYEEKIVNGEYKDLYNAYPESKRSKFKLNEFIPTIYKIREKIVENKEIGKDEKQLADLIKNKLVTSGVIVPVIKGITPAQQYRAEQDQKEEIKRNLDYIEKRLGDARYGIEEVKAFVLEYVNEEGAKNRLLYFVDRWNKEVDKIEKEAKEIEKSKDALESKLEKIKKLADKIDDLLKNEIVNEYEMQIVRKAVFFFVAALYTGTDGDIIELKKYLAMLSEIQRQSPLKYSFCANLIPTFIREISPTVYNAIVSKANVENAINTVLGAKEKKEQIENLKKLYGSAFVEYVLLKTSALEATLEAGKKIDPEIIKTAEILLNIDDSFTNAISEVLNSLEKKDNKKLEELKNRYGTDFVDYIKNNKKKIEPIFTTPEGYDLLNLAENNLIIFKELKQKYLPITDYIVLKEMDNIIDGVRNFRTQLNFAITGPTVNENAIKNAFNLYRIHFGDNVEFLRLIYDIDTIASKKIENVGEAEKLFKTIATETGKNEAIITSTSTEGEKKLGDLIKTSDLITKYYFLKAYELLNTYNLQDSAPAVSKAITTVASLDPYLLPQFFEKVITPLAEKLEGRPDVFTIALLTFAGSFEARYPKADASFLVPKIRERFIKIFDYFAEHLPEEMEKVTHWELQEETRMRGELGEYEVYPPGDLYMQRRPWWEGPATIGLPGMAYLQPPLDILPNVQITYPAQMPLGPLVVESGAEELHLRLDSQLNPFIPDFSKPTLSKDLRINYVSRQALLMAIRRAFGSVSMFSPEELISMTGQAGGFFRYEQSEEETTTETTTAGGTLGTLATRYPQGGLLGSMSGTETSKKIERQKIEKGEIVTETSEETETRVTGQLTGGGVGGLVHVDDYLNYTGIEKKDEKSKILSAQINTMIELAEKNGAMLFYIPDIYEEENIIGEERKVRMHLAGKIYYVNPNGEVYQLAVGHNTEDMLKQFVYGSAETENILASLRKYGLLEKEKFGDFGGAIGFTLDKIAAFAMEDAIRRTTMTSETVGDTPIYKVNLEAVGYSGVVALAINGVGDGTLAFIMRGGIPKTGATEGTYTLETIYRKIKPSKEWEIRVVCGYPLTVGGVYKERTKKFGKEEGLYAKAAVGKEIFYENIFSKENEAKNIVNYVKTALGEIYHWSDDKIEKEGNFIGLSLMLSSIEEEKDKMPDLKAQNFYASVIAAHYAKKWGGFVYAARQPGYTDQMYTISQMIENTRNEIMQYPERTDELISELAKQIEAMRNSSIWKEMAGVQFNLYDWTIRFLERADIMETKGKTDMGYSIVEGVAFVGYNKWIQPYLEMRPATYAGVMGRYLDLIFALGAANINFSPSMTFKYSNLGEIKNVNDLKNVLETNKAKIIYDILNYYKREDKPTDYEIEFTSNAKKEFAKKYYVLMLKSPTENKKVFYIGTEKDRERWVENGYNLESDIYTLGTEDNNLYIDVPTITTERWFRRVKFVGGVSFNIEDKELKNLLEEKTGKVGGFLTEVFQNVKQQLILGALAGDKTLKEGEIKQYAVVLSAKWDRINFKDLANRVYGYMVIDHTNHTITINPGEETIIDRTLFGAGVSVIYFDGLLGETSKINFFVQAGPEEITKITKGEGWVSKIMHEGPIGRVGGTYEWKNTIHGQDIWTNIGLIFYKGYWPSGSPLLITDYRTLYYPGGLKQFLKDYWGFMFTLGAKW